MQVAVASVRQVAVAAVRRESDVPHAPLADGEILDHLEVLRVVDDRHPVVAVVGDHRILAVRRVVGVADAGRHRVGAGDELLGGGVEDGDLGADQFAAGAAIEQEEVFAVLREIAVVALDHILVGQRHIDAGDLLQARQFIDHGGGALIDLVLAFDDDPDFLAVRAGEDIVRRRGGLDLLHRPIGGVDDDEVAVDTVKREGVARIVAPGVVHRGRAFGLAGDIEVDVLHNLVGRRIDEGDTQLAVVQPPVIDHHQLAVRADHRMLGPVAGLDLGDHRTAVEIEHGHGVLAFALGADIDLAAIRRGIAQTGAFLGGQRGDDLIGGRINQIGHAVAAMQMDDHVGPFDIGGLRCRGGRGATAEDEGGGDAGGDEGLVELHVSSLLWADSGPGREALNKAVIVPTTGSG